MVQTVVAQSQVCRTQNDVLSTAEQWKTALKEKGWQLTPKTFERS